MIKKIFFAAVLLVCAQAAMADNVLYAQVEGTNMTLKYGILMAIAREPSSMDSQNLLL